MKRKLPVIIITALTVVCAFIVFLSLPQKTKIGLNSQQAWEKQLQEKRNSKKEGAHKYDSPDEFALFQKGIRTKQGKLVPDYPANYTLKELRKAKNSQASYYNNANARTTDNTVWTERGPANVPGRTRAMVVLPQDATHNTWVIGSVGGGIWKTSDGGTNWVEKTKDLPNIAFTTIALAESNPNVLYAGTGEGGLGGVDGIGGNGIFKSIDSGETWSQLSFTSSNEDFQNINRLIVNPNDENVLLACNSYGAGFQSGIFKSVNGGVSWVSAIKISNSNTRGFQQIMATPGNFNVQYASLGSVGVYKSIDAGDTWTLSNSGMSPQGRIEIAASPVNANRIYASAEGSLTGSGSDLYVSDDAGNTWNLVDVSFGNASADFLGGQGWYDNTILCSPYDEDVVYVGGVSVLQVTLGAGGSSSVELINVEQDGTDTFMSFVNFGATKFGGALEVGSDANGTSVEIRFGAGLSQKAHRFTVPTGAGGGVDDADYTYQDYVEVPFEVWDVTNNKQLMASFRDQQVDGIFNLIEQNTDNDASTHSREYLYVNNVDYNATTADANIAVNGGHIFKEMYFFWPVLLSEATWDSNNLPSSSLRILVSNVDVLNASVDVAADPYVAFDGTNSFSTFGVDVHPDQHGMVAIKENDIAKTFRILLSGDGGPFISKTSDNPGVTQGDWTMVGNTYNTGQFYGADKKPGEDAYFGGMQDNGTWQSGVGADATTNYNFKIGGDGFEVLWHSQDPNKLIGGSQGNNFARSTNGGISFVNATNGLSGEHPFISKLAGSKKMPDVIYTVSSAGVFKSDNFGQNWNLTAITSDFYNSEYGATFLDVEVSRANPNIIWAGGGMSTSTNRLIHVSTDQGETFTATEVSNLVGGTITKLASHPTESNTGYVIFSQAQQAKILRTEDLGQTWVDISGFGSNTVSSNGFPDVAVYCLYVHFDDPNILWAGTDIGVVESVDKGANWHLLDSNMPKVAVWDMKGQDNQIVIATHGRGIWTATLENSQTNFEQGPMIISSGTSPQKELMILINAAKAFDSTQVIVDGELEKTFYAISTGDTPFDIPNIVPGTKDVELISFLKGAPIFTSSKSLIQLNLLEYSGEFTDFIKSSTNFLLEGMQVGNFENTGNSALQSFHNYFLDAEPKATLLQPIVVSNTNSIFSYEDIALIEPGEVGASFGEVGFKDYVVVEATKDGLSWVPIEDGYDATANASWLAAFNGSAAINSLLYVDHRIDLTDKFSVGDTLLFRFRLFSDAETFGWGWSIDNLFIQTEPLGLERAKDVLGYSVYPVPSQGNLTLEYQLTSSSDVFLEITSITGQKVKIYDLGSKSSGTYRFIYDNSNLERGTYIFSLKTKTGISSQRVLISK